MTCIFRKPHINFIYSQTYVNPKTIFQIKSLNKSFIINHFSYV